MLSKTCCQNSKPAERTGSSVQQCFQGFETEAQVWNLLLPCKEISSLKMFGAQQSQFLHCAVIMASLGEVIRP